MSPVETTAGPHRHSPTATGVEMTTALAVWFSTSAVPVECGFAFGQCLFQHVQPTRVVILDTMSLGSLHDNDRFSDTPPEPPFLRVLQTAAARAALLPACGEAGRAEGKRGTAEAIQHPVCPVLSPPNYIATLAAALLSHCEVRDVEAEVYLSLLSPHFETEPVSAYEAVLKRPELGQALLAHGKRFLAKTAVSRAKQYGAVLEGLARCLAMAQSSFTTAIGSASAMSTPTASALYL